MRYILLASIFLLCSCSWKSFAPTLGAGAGAGIGSLGGPGGAVAGGMIGASGGQLIKTLEEDEELKEKVEILSKGDIQGLVKHEMANDTGFQDFKSAVQNILMVAGALLGCYLLIPLWLARKTATECARTEAQKHLTRAPFPVPPPSPKP